MKGENFRTREIEEGGLNQKGVSSDKIHPRQRKYETGYPS